MRFNRAYELSITPNLGKPPINLSENDLARSDILNQYQTNQFIISHPVVRDKAASNGIGINFTVERAINVINNKATIEIYNLNKNAKRFLLQDIYSVPKIYKYLPNGDLELDAKGNPKYDLNYRFINLRAGYMGIDGQKKIFDQIFVGNLMEGGSGRQGTEFITKLYCQENGYFNQSSAGFINKSFNGAIEEDFMKEALNRLGYGFQSLIASEKTKAELKNSLPPRTFIGKSQKLLRNKYGLDFFTDRGMPFLLKEFEALESITSMIQVINSDTGLIGSPIRKDTNIEVRMMFEPRIALGQIIELQSATTSEYNGQYKVVAIKHKGPISASEEDDLITTLELYIGLQQTGGFKIVKI